MALEPFLLDLLEDPTDHQPLWYAAGQDVLLNPRTNVVYDVREGIPVLLPAEARPVDAAEAASLSADPAGRFTGPAN